MSAHQDELPDDYYQPEIAKRPLPKALALAAVQAEPAPEWLNRFHHLMKKHDLHPGRTDDDLLEILDAHLSAARPKATAEAVPTVTDEMIDAYLKANDAYWHQADQIPPKPGAWRTGTPKEATRASLIAAIAASHTKEQPSTDIDEAACFKTGARCAYSDGCRPEGCRSGRPLRGFGVTIMTAGHARNWYVGADCLKRWADNDRPTEAATTPAQEPKT